MFFFLKGRETYVEPHACGSIKHTNLDLFYFFSQKSPKKNVSPFFSDGMFAACKEKQNNNNMPLQNCISLPSIGRFVGEIAL